MKNICGVDLLGRLMKKYFVLTKYSNVQGFSLHPLSLPVMLIDVPSTLRNTLSILAPITPYQG